ncbi:hypothetical protein LIER_15863 [Lithospermum erythrorhizon]|uniref:Uncharacterized protein n=1 Tax=Lithospermum erythrorhizon TaxID=34254 RepID=A0AAV3Q9Q5_LITER
MDGHRCACLLADEEVSSRSTFSEVRRRRPTFFLFTFSGLSVLGLTRSLLGCYTFFASGPSGKGKNAPRLPSYVVSSSSKSLKKHSLPEDDSVDRDPKHMKWGTTKRLGLVVVSSSNVPAAVTKDVETTTVYALLLLGSSAYVIVLFGLLFFCSLQRLSFPQRMRLGPRLWILMSLRIAWSQR